MNEKIKIPTRFHITADVLPPIRLKHPLRQSSHQQPRPQADGTTNSSLYSHHGHKPLPCRLPPLDQNTSQAAVQDADGINNNTSEVSFDLHYGFETECDDALITEHERPKAPEPMILESLSNYDIGELLGKDEEVQCVTVAPAEISGSNNCGDQVAPACTKNTIHSKRNLSNRINDCLVLEDIDDSDYIDSQVFAKSTAMFIVQTTSQDQLIDDSIVPNENHHLGSAKEAITVSQKSITTNKANFGSQSSRLRRLASTITRAMSNKFRKLRHPTRLAADVPSKTDEKHHGHHGHQDVTVDGSMSTRNLL